MSAEVHFYFDYISSNAYLAWVRLRQIAAAAGAVIVPVPVLFAGLLEAHGQLGPAEVPAKAWWMFRNNLRKAAQMGVPLNPPRHHPFNPLLPLRLSSLEMPAEERHALVTSLFEAVWVAGVHPSDPEQIEEFLRGAGHAASERIAETQQEAVKLRLREQTDAAIARGVFGVPTMIVGDELFWGHDDLPFVELRLAGRDPLDEAQARRWLGPVRPSAVRRRFRGAQAAPGGGSAD